MIQLYNKIKEDNIRKYGTEAARTMKIIINQYSDRTHFIYEILQNAEDANATYMKLFLRKDRLEIRHNGRPFDEKDIVGVCGIAEGTKEDGTRIGHFGIGFKSVYAYTDTPVIVSGKYCFCIKNQLFPEEISPIEEKEDGETCMILPFDKEDVSARVAFQEIREALYTKITTESILMLENILEIEIQTEGQTDTVLISREKQSLEDDETVWAMNLMKSIRHHGKYSDEEENDYLYFTDREEKAAVIVFKVKGKELQEIQNSKLYAFFPTAKEAHQNFYIQAPFDTTPARDNFKEGSEYGKQNIKLVKQICQLIYYALDWLRDHEYLSVEGFRRVFPIYQYEKTDLLYAVYQNSIDIIRSGEKILPTNKAGVYKSINEICIPYRSNIVSVYDDTDIQYLFQKRKLYWLAKEISENAYTDLREFFKRNFNFQSYDWKDIVVKMDAAFLEKKSIQWLEKLMRHITVYCEKGAGVQQSYFDPSEIPFVRLSDGKHITAKNNGESLVYLNNPQICSKKIHADCLRSDGIHSFYNRVLHVSEYDIVTETVEKILPKYKTNKPAFTSKNTIKENISDLKEIKDAVALKNDILDEVKKCYLVTDGKRWYRPEDIYIYPSDQEGLIRSGFLLLKGIREIPYLTEKYFEMGVQTIRLDIPFFIRIGCRERLKKEECTEEVYLSTAKKYLGWQKAEEFRKKVIKKKYISSGMKWKLNYEGFPAVFQNMTKRRSLEIAKFLSARTAQDGLEIQMNITAADDRNMQGSNADTVMAYTMLGMQLCYEKWLYTSNQEEPQCVLDIEESDLLTEYRPVEKLLGKLPFRESDQGLAKYLTENYKNEEERKRVAVILKDPEKMAKISEAYARSEARNQRKKEKQGDIQTRLKQSDRTQQIKDTVQEEQEFKAISEKAKLKREEKLEQEFRESMEYKIKAGTGLYFARGQSSRQERTFLEEEYNGFCQICGHRIITYNGKNYFEAINMIKPSELLEERLSSLSLGWNAICLCPNCAAEYNYSSKKISQIYSQVMEKEIIVDSEDPVEISVEIPEGHKKIIRYSQRHFMALKKAFEIFTKE